MSHLFKRFSRDITGLIWLSMGIFFSLSLASFSPTDPSLNSTGKSLTVLNYCGYFGSFLSDILYQLLGVSAWVLVLCFLRLAVHSFKGEQKSKSPLNGILLVLLIVTVSSLISLYWPSKKIFQNQILVGGIFGSVFAKNLVAVFNFAGVAVILWTSLAALIVFYTEKPVRELLAWPIRLFNEVKEISRSLFAKKIKANVGRFFESLKGALLQQKVLAAAGGGATPISAASISIETNNLDRVPDSERKFSLRQLLPADREKGSFLPISNDDAASDDDDSSEVSAAPVARQEPAAPKKRTVKMQTAVQRKIENWELPKIDLLEDPPYNRKKVDSQEIRDKAGILINKLKQFEVEGQVMDAKPGPAVTLFEFKPNADVKISKITDLADDLSLALSAESVRIIAPIPGRDVVGIETSNLNRESVYLKDILASEKFWDEKTMLPIAMGCEADGKQKVVDLRRMPHMMVAGTTGSGKSVFIVSLLTGLLFRHSPKTLKLILIDPKQVDLATFARVPHLLMPPIREAKKAISALKWAIKEMDKRYRSMSKFKARDLESFNDTVKKLSSTEVADFEKFHEELGVRVALDSFYYTPQPYIVVVCEEFGDLMAVDKQNVEQAVVRLAQMARACGIHLVLAMQSPRKDVVTGMIKTNIPGRISFKVASKMDSRIILDESGAERLLTRGDMLFVSPGTSKPTRHHGPWVTDAEIAKVTEFWHDQAEPEYDPIAMKALEGQFGQSDGAAGGGDDFGSDMGDDGTGEMDERYDEIVAYISTLKDVSASLLQRRFRLGYPRAARLIEILEAQGVVGPANGSKPRQVLVNELK